MRGELVAIDLETTGLDPRKDAIIEVGAVRIANGEVIGEFSTMVNPGRTIPDHVTHITGIQHDDVLGAPSIATVLPQIESFVNNAPVIAHNTSLDMGFLQDRHNILRATTCIDTYDLASVLMPRAPRYNLNSLAHQVGIELEHAHRALDDARATALLYWVLWGKAVSLPHELLQEISNAARDLDWGSRIVFSEALRESTTSSTEKTNNLFAFTPLDTTPDILQPHLETQSISEQSILDIVGEAGILDENVPGFNVRLQQTEMAQAIATAFNQSKHLLAEAGTGTGKSIAYLVPAILWATLNNARVIISTNTLNLQDQLINKDIPALHKVLGRDFSASVMKGRNNYLCPRRLAAARRRRPTSIIEMRTLAKILVWLLESNSGDRGDISLRGPAESSVWQRLSAQDENCSSFSCEVVMHGTCPFHKAKKIAETSNLLIVNHALLISDANSDHQVLPDYQYAIIDEAHHLEGAITSGLSVHIDKASVARRLADLGGPKRGFLGEMLTTVKKYTTSREVAKLEQFVQIIGEATSVMDIHLQRLFASLHKFLQDVRDIRPTEYSVFVRISQQHREKSSFEHVRSVWKPSDEFFEVIGAAMLRLTKALHRLKSNDIPTLHDLIASAETAAHYMQEIRDQLARFLAEPDGNTIYWISLGQGAENPVVHMAPLHVGPIIEANLWSNNESVVLTSATLRTQDSFDYIRERLYADSAQMLEYGSPFDFRESTLVFVPNDIPGPTERQSYQQAVERGIIELATAIEGRMLVLFTSFSQLRQTSQAITPRLALGNIVVYDQSDGSSRQALLDGFRSTNKAVLLGTRSFWEGIDIPGEALSAVVIVRLPFTVPSDPIFAARSDTFANAFTRYAVPEAILRFRQGFGRLIRSHTDRGIFAIFDSRVLTKSYGVDFLEALPDCTMREGPLEALPEAARDWLARK